MAWVSWLRCRRTNCLRVFLFVAKIKFACTGAILSWRMRSQTHVEVVVEIASAPADPGARSGFVG